MHCIRRNNLLESGDGKQRIPLLDKEHEFEEQNILQEFLFYLHSPGIAECGDAERQSCGQYDAGRIQRDFSGRRCGGEPDTIRLSAVPAGLRRRACNLLQPVLGQEADRSDEEDCRDGYACRTFDCHCAVCPGQPVFPAVGIFTTDGPIIGEGVRYLRIIRFTYLFFAVTQLLLAALRSTETVRIAFQLSILTFFINCGINYVLIFGNFGAPRMGVRGAAVGTLIARMIECAVLIAYIAKKDKNLNLKLKDYLQFDRVLAKDYFKVTAPMLFVQGLWGVNTALQTVILGHMKATAIAANSVASTLFLMVKSTAVGASSAASVIIGKTIGTGDIARVKEYSGRLQKMFIVIGVLSGIFLFFIRIPVLGLYDLQPATKEMANAFLIILSVVCVGMSYQMPTNNGIIRGGGNAMFVVKMDLVSIWMIVLPLSFIMAFVVKASPIVVVCCLNADQIFKCVPAFLESHYGNWIRKLTREA